MKQEDKIKHSYEEMIKNMPERYKIQKLLNSVVSSDLEIIELENEKAKLEEEIEALKRNLLAEKEKFSCLPKQKNTSLIKPGEIEVYSTNIITTVFDYEEDEGMPYFRIPDKEAANELLVDSGLALCAYKIKVHIEVIK